MKAEEVARLNGLGVVEVVQVGAVTYMSHPLMEGRSPMLFALSEWTPEALAKQVVTLDNVEAKP